jgi:hypothetical protein
LQAQVVMRIVDPHTAVVINFTGYWNRKKSVHSYHKDTHTYTHLYYISFSENICLLFI